jgi:hypothetical protein
MRIRLIILFVIVAVMSFYSHDSFPRIDRTKAECEKTKQKISKIESKMRQGYRASEGVKMDDELRRLRKLRSKYCR